MPSNLLPTEPTYSSGTTDEGEYLSAGERKAIFKKKRVSGADFKRGSSAGSSVGESRGGKLTSKDFESKTGKLAKILRETRSKVLVNEKKITALELKDTKELEPGEDQGKGKGTESLIGPLKNIDSGVNGIIETLKASNKADTKAQSDARKRAEKDARAQKEGKLEGIKGKLANAAETVLAPVKNIFQKIWDFLKIVFLGRVVMKLFEWFTNPENGKKVASLFRFLKDWWPVIVAGIMAVVGPGMIFTAGLIALLVWGVPKIIEAVKWVGSLFGIGVDKELKKVEDNAAKTGDDLTKTIDNDLTKDTEGVLKNNQGEVSETGESPDVDKTPAQVSETQKQATDVQAGADEVGTLPTKMASGGIVPGSGSGDTVPAMLTPGEFVMSKGAVNQYGANTLAGMNAAAGGTNRPTRGGYQGGGTIRPTRGGYQGGGTVQNVSNKNIISEGMSFGGPRINYAQGGMVNSLKGSTNFLNVPQTFISKQPLQFAGGGSVPEAKIVRSSPSNIVINPPSMPSPEIIAEDPVGEANTRVSTRTAPNQELPEFSASQMRSLSKIKTLGVMV